MSDKFSFIPFQDQVLPVKDNGNASIADVLENHRIVSNSGTNNFFKVSVASSLAVESRCVREISR